MLVAMCFVSIVRLVALNGFVRTASLTSRAGEEGKTLANAAAVSDGVQGKSDWHDAFMGFAHTARKAAEKSYHSIDLLAILPDALSQDDRVTFAGDGFTVLPRPPFVPLKEVGNTFGSSELLKGCCGEAENLKLYASELVDCDLVLVLDDDVMRLGAFDELVDLQNPLLDTNDYEVNLPNSAFSPIKGRPRDFSEPTVSGAAVSCCTVALSLYLFTSSWTGDGRARCSSTTPGWRRSCRSISISLCLASWYHMMLRVTSSPRRKFMAAVTGSIGVS